VLPSELRTYTGAERSVFELSPSWPLSLAPHAQTVPLLLSARQWVLPAAVALTPVSRPSPPSPFTDDTGCGLAETEPMPS
jgi:hypothetical protein